MITINNGSDSELFQSAYVCLTYSYLANKNFNCAVNTAKETLNIPNLNDEYRFDAIMYMVEAYCHLGKCKEVNIFISFLIKLYKATNFVSPQANNLPNNLTFPTKSRNILGANHTFFMKTLTPKIILFINIISLHLLNNNFQMALTNINNLTASLDNTGTLNVPYPLPLINLMIYYYLSTGI